jgi:hypothetical protein
MNAALSNPDALVKRLNRAPAMRRDGLQVRACAERSRQRQALGAFYLVDARGVVTQTDVNLERLAGRLGVLRTDDTQQAPLSMTLAQAEALLYEAREQLADCTVPAAERGLRVAVEEAQTRVNLLRAAQARGAA